MSWALKGLAGPLKDKVFTLRAGLTLGRQGDVQILDLKASAIHARVSLSATGSWVIEDNNSKNGLRVHGERMSAAPLAPGGVFHIGDQGFEVIELHKETQVAEDPTLPTAVPVAAPLKPAKGKRPWYTLLASFLDKNADKFPERVIPVSPLTPALVLEFTRGVQVSCRWVIGYAPRKVGSAALDLPIWEPGAPAVCFEIVASLDGILFKTKFSEMVQVNGEAVDSHRLCVGDTIRINETMIEVDFIE